MSEIKVELKLVSIESDFSISSLKKEALSVVTFNISSEVKVLSEQKNIINTVKVEILDTKTDEVLAICGCDFTYNIENFNDLVKIDGKNVSLPNQLIGIMNGFSINGIRGILHSEMKDTYLKNNFLPLLAIPNSNNYKAVQKNP